jgi:hypothetical protein
MVGAMATDDRVSRTFRGVIARAVPREWTRGFLFGHLWRGQCYERAFKYLLDHDIEGMMLVHGTRYGIPHAWVELPGDVVFDGTVSRFFDRESYYQVQRVVKEVEYTKVEACRKATEANPRRRGPWHYD